MLTEQHRQTLLRQVKQLDAATLHATLQHMSVADQKQAKILLARYLADRHHLSLPDCLSLYSGLLSQSLNMYFNMFCLAVPALRQEPTFWEHLDCLSSLGELLSRNRVFYRQKLLDLLLLHIEPERPVQQLFRVLQVHEARAQLVYLMQADSLYGYYQFVQIASQHDVEASFLSQCAKHILTYDKSSIPAYVRLNIVTFLVHFFNGVQISASLSPTIHAGLLSYAEHSYDAFCKVVMPSRRIDW